MPCFPSSPSWSQLVSTSGSQLVGTILREVKLACQQTGPDEAAENDDENDDPSGVDPVVKTSHGVKLGDGMGYLSPLRVGLNARWAERCCEEAESPNCV